MSLLSHAASNLFSAIVLAFAGSAFDTPSIFYTDRLNSLLSLASFLAMSALFYLVIFVVLR